VSAGAADTPAQAGRSTPAPGREPRALARGPVIAIAGRPNAGKSTLFNRLLRRRRAIVDETPGVTRDENRAEVVREGRRYELVDTGGIEELSPGPGLSERVQRRSLDVLRAADVVVHLVDGKAGLSAADRAVAQTIRTLGVPAILAVNKVDRDDQRSRLADFAALGAADPVAVSSAHGLGVDDLWERIEAELARAGRLPEPEAGPAGTAGEASPVARGAEVAAVPAAVAWDVEGGAVRASVAHGDEGAAVDHAATPVVQRAVANLPPRIALIGRPNVGKSSLLNRLVGFERAIVDATPGTTRDSIDVPIERAGRHYVIVDTAGLRRPSRIVETIEGYAAAASLRAIERCEVAVLVLDATLGVSDQDMRLADLVWRRGRGFVIAVNKVDLAPELAAEQCHDTIARRLPQWPPLPLVRVSALAGTGLSHLFSAVDGVVAAYRRRIPTARLNDVVAAAVEAHPPPLVRGKPPKILYAAQMRSGPQEIALVAGHPEGVTVEYRRYLLHRVRDAFGLVGVPVRLVARERTRTPRDRRGASGAGAAQAGVAGPTDEPARARATAKGTKSAKSATSAKRSGAGRRAKPPAPRRAVKAGKLAKPGKAVRAGKRGAKGLARRRSSR
jgi:GTP-binding protein